MEEKPNTSADQTTGKWNVPSYKTFRKVKWIKRKRGLIAFFTFLFIAVFILFFDYYWALITRIVKQPSREAEKAAGRHLKVSEAERKGVFENTRKFLDAGKVEEARLIILGYLQKEGNAEGNYLAGLVYMKQGDIQTAYRYFREATRLNPSLYEAQQKLAEIYLTLGDLKSAHQSASILQKDGAFREDGLILQSEIDVEEGKFDQALKKIESLLEKKHSVSEINYIRLASLYVRKGERKKAQEIVNKVTESKLDAIGLLMLSRYFLSTGETEKSMTVLENALKRYPESPEIQYHYGQRLFTQQQYAESIPYFEKVYKAMPQSRIAAYRYGQALIASGRLNEAKQHIDNLLSKTSNDILAMSLKVRCDLLNQNRGEAIKVLKQTVALVPEAPRPHTLLAELYWAEGILTVAEAYAHRALKLGEQSTSPRIVLGDIYFRKGQYAKAVEQYGKILEREPNNIVALVQSADARLNLNEIQKAQSLYERVLLLYPGINMIRVKLEMVRNLQKGPKEVLRIAANYYQQAPDDFEAVAGYYRALILNNYLDEAEAVLRKEMKRNPKSVQYAVMLGDLYLLKRNLPAAKKTFDEALKIAPKELNTLMNIGSRYEKNGLDKDAEGIYLTLTKLYPQNMLVINQLAWFYTDTREDFEKAKPFIETLRVKGEGAYEKDTVGWFFYKTGDYVSAEAFFRDAIQMDPDNNVIRGHLALTLFKMEKSTEARKEAQKVIPVLPPGALKESLSRLASGK